MMGIGKNSTHPPVCSIANKIQYNGKKKYAIVSAQVSTVRGEWLVNKMAKYCALVTTYFVKAFTYFILTLLALFYAFLE